MKKLIASIIVLIIATTISFMQTEVTSNDTVQTEDPDKEILRSAEVSVLLLDKS